LFNIVFKVDISQDVSNPGELVLLLIPTKGDFKGLDIGALAYSVPRHMLGFVLSELLNVFEITSLADLNDKGVPGILQLLQPNGWQVANFIHNETKIFNPKSVVDHLNSLWSVADSSAGESTGNSSSTSDTSSS
jgi:hypothetical protein